jgi:hypothetical protein
VLVYLESRGKDTAGTGDHPSLASLRPHLIVETRVLELPSPGVHDDCVEVHLVPKHSPTTGICASFCFVVPRPVAFLAERKRGYSSPLFVVFV